MGLKEVKDYDNQNCSKNEKIKGNEVSDNNNNNNNNNRDKMPLDNKIFPR